MKTIYIVTGSTGEWDGYCWWNVRAFTTRFAAASFLGKLNGIIHTTHKNLHEDDWGYRDRLAQKLKRLDKSINHIDSNGVTYRSEPLKMETK